jgi:hypothetical protein
MAVVADAEDKVRGLASPNGLSRKLVGFDDDARDTGRGAGDGRGLGLASDERAGGELDRR